MSVVEINMVESVLTEYRMLVLLKAALNIEPNKNISTFTPTLI